MTMMDMPPQSCKSMTLSSTGLAVGSGPKLQELSVDRTPDRCRQVRQKQNSPSPEARAA